MFCGGEYETAGIRKGIESDSAKRIHKMKTELVRLKNGRKKGPHSAHVSMYTHVSTKYRMMAQ